MKSKLFGILYSLALTAFTAFVLLDYFVIEEVYEVVDDGSISLFPSSELEEAGSEEPVASDITVESSEDSSAEVSDETSEEPVVSDVSVEESRVPSIDIGSGTVTNQYEDENIKIVISEYRVEDTTVYVADVNIVNTAYLKTAFAEDKFGKNIKAKTSYIASYKNAILAINGDYYSMRNGCVLRNGKLYRGFSGDAGKEALVINQDGSFDFVYENQADAESLAQNGAWQIFSFGPALVKSGKISVGVNDEVDKAMRNNPRTAIAWFGGTHYAFVVGDGRTSESQGLSLYELAVFLQSLNVKAAYNLDGGGSATMYFDGKVINKPTTNGNKIQERSVSDIVYIGY